MKRIVIVTTSLALIGAASPSTPADPTRLAARWEGAPMAMGVNAPPIAVSGGVPAQQVVRPSAGDWHRVRFINAFGTASATMDVASMVRPVTVGRFGIDAAILSAQNFSGRGGWASPIASSEDGVALANGASLRAVSLHLPATLSLRTRLPGAISASVTISAAIDGFGSDGHGRVLDSNGHDRPGPVTAQHHDISAIKLPVTEPAPAVALTFDDLPAHGPLPAGTSRLGVVETLIAALRAQAAPAFGFVNGSFGRDDPESPAVLAAWRRAGLPLGNHTFSHWNLDSVAADSFERDVVRNEAVVAPLMSGVDWRWLRYPFLAEGTAAKRDAVRGFLAERGYRIAAVTMSFGDFGWNEPYARCIAARDDRAVAGLEESYLAAARDEATRERMLSRALYGRDIPYVLLMHAGAFDARMLPRLLALYRQMGFRFVTLAEAEADPFYATAIDPRRSGFSPTLTAAAAAAGLPVPVAAPLPAAALCR